MEKVRAHDYSGAYETIYKSFDYVNQVPRKDYDLNFYKLDFTKIKGTPPGAITDRAPSGGPNLVTFYTNYWDQFWSGKLSYGWLVKSIYHEMTHVMQYHGIGGFTNLPYNEAEFQSNYLQIMNRNLPCMDVGETNFYVKIAIQYLTDDPNKTALMSKYRFQVQTLLYQVDADTRKGIISDIKDKTKTDINFR